MDNPDELISLDEAAKLIPGADRGTLLRAARAGKLTVYRVGKSYSTTRSDIRKLIEACRIVPQRSAPPAVDIELADMALESELALAAARARLKRRRGK